ncbi:MAG: polysaccharide deacetylase family protein [Prolixibacteraceae bacterium]
MNKKVRHIAAAVGDLIPFSLLSNRVDYPPFLPFYHLVSDMQHEYITSYLVRTQQQFEKELDYLLSHFKAVSLEEILASPDKNKMHLTFDDGLKECASLIAPILIRKGIPATFFVSPNFVDNKALFHRFKQSILVSKGILPNGGKKFYLHETEELDRLAQLNAIDFTAWQPYMNLSDISSLNSDGFSIGAHSMNHPEMWLLNEEDQFRQVADSMNWVVDHFNPPIKAFSFPFTDDGIKLSLFERLNQQQIVDVTFGTAGLKFDQFKNHLQRIPVELPVNWSIKKVVHFEYFYFKIRNLFSANVVRRN